VTKKFAFQVTFIENELDIIYNIYYFKRVLRDIVLWLSITDLIVIHTVLYNGIQYCHQRIFSNTVVIISDNR